MSDFHRPWFSTPLFDNAEFSSHPFVGQSSSSACFIHPNTIIHLRPLPRPAPAKLIEFLEFWHLMHQEFVRQLPLPSQTQAQTHGAPGSLTPFPSLSASFSNSWEAAESPVLAAILEDTSSDEDDHSQHHDDGEIDEDSNDDNHIDGAMTTFVSEPRTNDAAVAPAADHHQRSSSNSSHAEPAVDLDKVFGDLSEVCLSLSVSPDW